MTDLRLELFRGGLGGGISNLSNTHFNNENLNSKVLALLLLQGLL